MARRLTTTIALVLALGASGCGTDDTSDTTAKGAATATPAGDAATDATSASGSKQSSGSRDSSGSKTSSGSKKSSSGSKKTSSAAQQKTSASKTSSGSKTGGSKSSSGSKKQTSGSKTPATAAGGSPSGAAGGADPRLAVLATVRRYQKDFVDRDSNDACLLLTAAGKKQMIAGGRGQTCAESVKRILDQARDSDIELIKETRAGIHVGDVKIRGDDATVSIGKGQRLRMVRRGGRWLVDDPSP